MEPPAAGAQSPIRVLLWSTKGAGRHYGGPGMSAWRLYSKAAPGRFHITLAHGFAKQEPQPVFAEQCLVAPYSTSLTGQLGFILRARQWIRQNAPRFDVMHGLQGFEPTLAPAFEAQKRGLPAVVKLAAHRADLSDKNNWRTWLGVHRRRRRKAMQLAGVIAISREIERELLSYGFPASKIARIPNGVDTDQFLPVTQDQRSEIRRQLGWRDMPTILFVGGMVRRKRPHLLVEAVAVLHRQGISVQLAMVGPGHDAAYVSEMKQRAAQLGVTELVIWPGFTTNIAPAYQASDVFSLPSSNEGMANAVLEASASGIPVVVTPASGMADLVEEGVTGVVTEPGPEALAEALRAIVESSARRDEMGAAGRAFVMERFSAEAVLDAHERLFRRIMSGGPAAE